MQWGVQNKKDALNSDRSEGQPPDPKHAMIHATPAPRPQSTPDQTPSLLSANAGRIVYGVWVGRSLHEPVTRAS